eukprot:TRINITY_DN2020_c0_g1_i1.p2 TRINITY_DN2020_c0_g1~~TRINITY_DN2020_c0_g1_i1.p2  ORF type:complete len:103 (-),score=1.06 TRINITY_DN2020_c0_g1_i1:2-310(-)
MAVWFAPTLMLACVCAEWAPSAACRAVSVDGGWVGQKRRQLGTHWDCHSTFPAGGPPCCHRWASPDDTMRVIFAVVCRCRHATTVLTGTPLSVAETAKAHRG